MTDDNLRIKGALRYKRSNGSLCPKGSFLFHLRWPSHPSVFSGIGELPASTGAAIKGCRGSGHREGQEIFRVGVVTPHKYYILIPSDGFKKLEEDAVT